MKDEYLFEMEDDYYNNELTAQDIEDIQRYLDEKHGQEIPEDFYIR